MAFNLNDYNKVQNLINIMNQYDSRILGYSLSTVLKDLRISSYNLPKLLTEENGFNMKGDLTQRLLEAYKYQKNIKKWQY